MNFDNVPELLSVKNRCLIRVSDQTDRNMIDPNIIQNNYSLGEIDQHSDNFDYDTVPELLSVKNRCLIRVSDQTDRNTIDTNMNGSYETPVWLLNSTTNTSSE